MGSNIFQTLGASSGIRYFGKKNGKKKNCCGIFNAFVFTFNTCVISFHYIHMKFTLIQFIQK